MRPVDAVCLVLGLALFALSSDAAQADSLAVRPVSDASAITYQVDRLFTLQDSAARGGSEAVSGQRQLLRSITASLQALDDEHFPQMVEETVAYVLSGGDPAVVERVLRAPNIPDDEKDLLRAAASFMSGDRTSAIPLFKKIDPTNLPARLAGRIALAKAILEKGQERLSYFTFAIAAMPGTLVEESAIRRSALAYADVRDERNMWRMLERYARRFPSSVFARSFWQDVINSLVSWMATAPGPQIERLDHVAAMLPRGQRQSLYLALARVSAARGLAEPTGFAGKRLHRLAAEGSAEAQLGRFYANLFVIVTPEGDLALDHLRSIPREALGPQESSLLDAAISVGLQIARPAADARPETDIKEEEGAIEHRGVALLSQSYDLLAENN